MSTQRVPTLSGNGRMAVLSGSLGRVGGQSQVIVDTMYRVRPVRQLDIAHRNLSWVGERLFGESRSPPRLHRRGVSVGSRVGPGHSGTGGWVYDDQLGGALRIRGRGWRLPYGRASAGLVLRRRLWGPSISRMNGSSTLVRVGSRASRPTRGASTACWAFMPWSRTLLMTWAFQAICLSPPGVPPTKDGLPCHA